MIEKMVFEKRIGRNLSGLDKDKVLRFVHESFLFRDEQEIEEDRDQFIIVMAKADVPNSNPEPILKEDFYRNTLRPIAEKGRQLLGGHRPFLSGYNLDEQTLVFLFSPLK